MKIVKDLVMYQATTRDYKIGDIIKFGEERNFQAERVFATNYRIDDKENKMPEMFLESKLKKKKKLKPEEMRNVCNILWNYGVSMRELGMEICRQLYHSDEPSRLKGMFLCEKPEEAKLYLSTAKSKNNVLAPKVVGVKLNGKILKTSNSFNRRDGNSLDEFIEQAHKYWNGVDDSFEDKQSIEYLFEGTAEIVEIIE